MAFILVIGAAAIAALLWCLYGFTQASKEPRKVIGLLVSPRMCIGRTSKRHALLIEFPNLEGEQAQASQGIPRLRFSRIGKLAFKQRLDLSQQRRDVEHRPWNEGINRLK